MATNYCEEDPLGDAEIIACPKDDLVGGFASIILLEEGHGITDPSSAAQINAAKLAGLAHQIDRVSFWTDTPAPVETESLVPCEPASTTNYTRSGGYINPNVTPNNVDLHDRMFDGRVFDGVIAANCGKDGVVKKVFFHKYKVKITGGLTQPQKNTEFQRFDGKWSATSIKNPSMHNAPVGIFS